MDLLCYLRSKRAMAEHIADLKEEVRSVSEACNQWHGKWRDNSELVDTLESRSDALAAELKSVRAEANRLLVEAGLRETRLAELQHQVEQAEQDRTSLAAERDMAVELGNKIADQRDEAAKERDYWKARDAAWLTENDGIRKERDAAIKTGEFVEAKAREAYGLVFKANAILETIGVPEDTVDAPEPYLNLADDDSVSAGESDPSDFGLRDG